MTEKYIPPEGGWGYMICVGFTIIFIIGMSQGSIVGMVFNDLLRKEPVAAPFIFAVYGFMIAIAGPISSFMLKRLSARTTGVFGGLVFSANYALTAFVPTPYAAVLTYGVLGGLGWGVVQNAAYVAFNSYFVSKRVHYTGVCMTIVSATCIATPFVLYAWIDAYGYRATLMLLGAVSANILVGACLFDPVEWHLRPRSHRIRAAPPSVDAVDAKRSLSSLTVVLEKTNLIFLKDFKYVAVSLAIISGNVSDVSFTFYLGLLLHEFGMSSVSVAYCLAITAFMDLISRITIAVIGKFVKIRSYYWYYLSLIITFCARLFFLSQTDYWSILVSLGVIGYAKAWISTLFPILLAEETPYLDYAQAFGLTSLMSFSFNIIYTIVACYTIPVYKSYIPTYYCITLSLLLGIIPATVDILKIRPPIKLPNESNHT